MFFFYPIADTHLGKGKDFKPFWPTLVCFPSDSSLGSLFPNSCYEIIVCQQRKSNHLRAELTCSQTAETTTPTRTWWQEMPLQGADMGPAPSLRSFFVSLQAKAETSALKVPNIAFITWAYWLWVYFIFVPFSIFLVLLFNSHFNTKKLPVLILFRCFIRQMWGAIPKWPNAECTWWKFHF